MEACGVKRILGKMIEIERLSVNEFDLLKDVGDGYVPDPARSIVVVARNLSGIIGRIFIMAPAHVEGVFIEEAWRKGPLMKQLVEAVELEAKSEGITQVLAYAKDAQMENYIKRLGYSKTPFTVWEKRL